MLSFRLEIDPHELGAPPKQSRFHQQHGNQHKVENHRKQEHGPAAPARGFRFQFQDQMKLWLFGVSQTQGPVSVVTVKPAPLELAALAGGPPQWNVQLCCMCFDAIHHAFG